jgi:hypothetical protein
MVVNSDGREAFVTADPMLANVNIGQRALPLYTAPVMDTCADVRSSSPTSGGGFVERELAVARGMASCRGDDARLDEADAEIAELRGQATVLRRLLADALAVMRTVEPDDTDEAERLESLCAAVAMALQPKREGALL